MAGSLSELSSTASTALSKPAQHVQLSDSDGTKQLAHTDPGLAYWMRTEIPEEELRENEDLEALFWKDWTPDVDWRNGEYYPQIRHHETGKWFDAEGYCEALDKLLDKRNIIPVDNRVSAQVAMAVVRDLEEEMERGYRGRDQANRIEEIDESEEIRKTEISDGK